MDKERQGFTLISALISILILALVSLALYSIFDLSLKIISENKYRVNAIALANQKTEMIRNLPYNSIGTQGGIPAGPLPQTETILANGKNFDINIQIIYIDDPFDGLISSIPPDLLNTDYKRVKVTAAWTSRFNYQEAVVLMTDIAPKNIETTVTGGTLIIKVFNADGDPVPQADVHIENNQVAPPILINNQTNAQGTLIFPGAPPAQESYEVTVTKPGYSTDYTSPITPQNPSPTKPDASVYLNQVTEISFFIDLVSTFNISTISQDLAGEWKASNDTTGSTQDYPDVSVDVNNNYYFFWRDERTGQSRIFAQKYDSNKTQIWPQDLSITTSNNQIYPRVSTDIDGNSYVAWQDDRNGNQDIYLDKFSNNGLPLWGGAKKVNTLAENIDQNLPAIAANTSTVYVAWQDDRDGSMDIFARRYDINGNQIWANEIKMNTDSGSATQSYANVSIDNNNNLIILWQDDRNGNNDIYAQKLDPDGNHLWADDLKINTNYVPSSQGFPAIAISGLGEIFFAWQDDRNGNNDIYAQKYDLAGNKIWANDIKINTDIGNSDQKRPRLAYDFAGYAIFTWYDNRDGTYDIFAAKFKDPGTITYLSNIPLQIRGSKTIGLNPIIYKYDQIDYTNGAGLLTLDNMEWDSYTIVPTTTVYELTESVPGQPINLLPNTTTAVILNLDNE